MQHKEAITIEEQIAKMQERKIQIADIDKAKEILLRENYFFINGYRFLLMNSYSDKTFVIGSTFHELHSIFLFDRSFRTILFKNLLIIENQLKSVISYQLSKKYGYRDKDYLIEYMMLNAHDGDIILLHDIHESTALAAQEFIPKLAEKGYQLVTVSELLAAKGVDATSGKIYRGRLFLN